MMNLLAPITPGLDSPAGTSQTPLLLPCWEQLPPERQRELILTLAAIVVKRLPGQMPSQPEVEHE